MKTLVLAVSVVATGAVFAAEVADAFVTEARQLYLTDEYADCKKEAVSLYYKGADKPGWTNDYPSASGNDIVTWYRVGGTVRNVRDIGGWTGLRRGRVYRGTQLSVCKKDQKHYIDESGKDFMLNTLGIRTDMDFRHESEAGRGEYVHSSPLGPTVELVGAVIQSYTNIFVAGYKPALQKMMRTFADSTKYPIYMHCMGGADRTGSAAFILEGLCGVSEPDLRIDYELTSFSGQGSRKSYDPSEENWFQQMYAMMKAYPGSTWSEKIENYCKTFLELNDAEIASIRANLVSAPGRSFVYTEDTTVTESLALDDDVLLDVYPGVAVAVTTGAWAEDPNLRVGILSDVHVKRGQSRSWDYFCRALSYLREREVDAVLIAGDLVTWGSYDELRDFAALWYNFFPNDRLPNGNRVERLFLTGNHDVDGFAYNGSWAPRTMEEAKAKGFYFNRGKFWKELFHEDYEPVFFKEVKGYKFVLRNWTSILGREQSPSRPLTRGFRDEPSPLPEWFRLHGAELPRDKPFFYAQHEPLLETCCAPYVTDDSDDGLATRMLSRYPNAIAFSGHSHRSLLENRTIWQGKFTSVGCSSTCGWEFTRCGHENGHASDDGISPAKEMPPLDFQDCHQGMVMEVYGDRIVLERRDFVHGRRLGEDWVIPIGTGADRPYGHARQADASLPPQFPADAEISLRVIAEGANRAGERHPQLEVSFPTVNGLDGGARAYDYEVTLECGPSDSRQLLARTMVYSPGALQPAEFDRAPTVCRFRASLLPAGVECHCTVVPVNEWGKRGRGIGKSFKEGTKE